MFYHSLYLSVSYFIFLWLLAPASPLSSSLFRSSGPSTPLVQGLPHPSPELLVQSLSKAFPQNTHNHPAFSSALALLHSLDSKPSCYRTATAALVHDCENLDTNAASNGGLKISYAAHLAICELHSTGISIPGECRSVDRMEDERALEKCVKRLETRPQWWTTLSNNIQNAMVICTAIKHEVERGKSATQCEGSVFFRTCD